MTSTFEIIPCNDQLFYDTIKMNIDPLFSQTAKVFYEDELGEEWTMMDGVLANSNYTFRNAQKILEGTVLRFTCTRGLINGSLEIPLGEGVGFPHVYAEIMCANEDGSLPSSLRRVQLKRLNKAKDLINSEQKGEWVGKVWINHYANEEEFKKSSLPDTFQLNINLTKLEFTQDDGDDR